MPVGGVCVQTIFGSNSHVTRTGQTETSINSPHTLEFQHTAAVTYYWVRGDYNRWEVQPPQNVKSAGERSSVLQSFSLYSFHRKYSTAPDKARTYVTASDYCIQILYHTSSLYLLHNLTLFVTVCWEENLQVHTYIHVHAATHNLKCSRGLSFAIKRVLLIILAVCLLQVWRGLEHTSLL